MGSRDFQTIEYNALKLNARPCRLITVCDHDWWSTNSVSPVYQAITVLLCLLSWNGSSHKTSVNTEDGHYSTSVAGTSTAYGAGLQYRAVSQRAERAALPVLQLLPPASKQIYGIRVYTLVDCVYLLSFTTYDSMISRTLSYSSWARVHRYMCQYNPQKGPRNWILPHMTTCAL